MKRCTLDTTMYLKSSRNTKSSTRLKEIPTMERKTKQSIRILMDCYNGLKPKISSLTYLIVENDYEERVYLSGSDVYFTTFVISVLLGLHCMHRTNLISLGKNRNNAIFLHNVSNIYLVHCII